jgi:hypothetical protein
MEFNQLGRGELLPVLAANGFFIVEEYDYAFRFRSATVMLSVSYNVLDRTALLEAGSVGGYLYPVDDDVIKNVFGSPIKIEQVTMEVFLHHVVLFLKGVGSAILRGDRGALDKIKRFVEDKSKNHTAKVVEKQTLTQVDEAWSNGGYADVVRLMGKLRIEELPSSYQLKYKMAVQRK